MAALEYSAAIVCDQNIKGKANLKECQQSPDVKSPLPKMLPEEAGSNCFGELSWDFDLYGTAMFTVLSIQGRFTDLSFILSHMDQFIDACIEQLLYTAVS